MRAKLSGKRLTLNLAIALTSVGLAIALISAADASGLQGVPAAAASGLPPTPTPTVTVPTSDPVKRAAGNLGDALTVTSIGFGVVSGLLLVGSAPVSVPVGTVLLIGSGIFGVGAVGAYRINRDPVDPNYTVLARPVFHRVPAPPSGLTARERSAYEDLGANLLTQSSLAYAAWTSYNRSAGATQAGSEFWAKAQYRLAVTYIHELGWQVLAQPQLQVHLVSALKAAGVPDVRITAGQVRSWQAGIRANGLPSSELRLLRSFGASAGDIQILTSLETALDPSRFGGTTLFTMLTDPAALAALETQAKALITAN
jgi:hypothetical protein